MCQQGVDSEDFPSSYSAALSSQRFTNPHVEDSAAPFRCFSARILMSVQNLLAIGRKLWDKVLLDVGVCGVLLDICQAVRRRKWMHIIQDR